jgi:cytochrome d ubiquinol oxidase subunit II
MHTFWYGAVSVMLATYVVLDGFDLGAAALHLIVAKDDRERREVLAAIGPVWDGNEVWLIAGGGLLFFAFPQAYAAGFSGFYLPLMLALWLLILRGLALELRSHEASPVWRAFCDATLCCSSAGLAIVLGAALGNVLRGVPLDESGSFLVPFFTDFRPGPLPGVLDWYTVLIGVFALVALMLHGALWLCFRTEGQVHLRSVTMARRLWVAEVIVGMASISLTAIVRGSLYRNLLERPLSWPVVLLAAASIGAIPFFLWRKRHRDAFLASAAFLTATLAATAFGLFPVLLPSTISVAYSLSAPDAAAADHGLRVGLAWWALGLPLAIAYTVHSYRSLGGKVRVPAHDDHH